MIKAFIAIFAGFWDLLKFPLLYLGILALVFLVLLGIFFSQEWLSGRRPAPTSVRYVQRPGLFKSLFYMTPRQMVEDWFSKPADFFNPQGLIIFTGRQGRGKTIAMAELSCTFKSLIHSVRF